VYLLALSAPSLVDNFSTLKGRQLNRDTNAMDMIVVKKISNKKNKRDQLLIDHLCCWSNFLGSMALANTTLSLRPQLLNLHAVTFLPPPFCSGAGAHGASPKPKPHPHSRYSLSRALGVLRCGLSYDTVFSAQIAVRIDPG
jgi:hypothetical protein